MPEYEILIDRFGRRRFNQGSHNLTISTLRALCSESRAAEPMRFGKRCTCTTWCKINGIRRWKQKERYI